MKKGIVGLVAPTPYTSQNCTPINSTPKFDEDMREYSTNLHSITHTSNSIINLVGWKYVSIWNLKKEVDTLACFSLWTLKILLIYPYKRFIIFTFLALHFRSICI
jgi:hypothetical protein